jgi:hypothetical protein
MSELKHWLDESSDADDFERAILRSGLDVDPPAAKCEEVWAGITSALVAGPLLTNAAAGSAKAAAASASKGAAVWLGIGKGFVLGLAVYGAATGVSAISQRFSARPATPITAGAPSPSMAKRALPRVAPLAPLATAEPAATEAAPSAIVQVASSAAPTAAGNGAAPAKSPSATARSVATLPSVAAFDDAGSASRVSQLQAETQALRTARAELRSGRLADAFATLEASRRQFSAPELYQEREALMIELLQRSGQASAAAERAADFLSRFPESPHAGQIRQLVRR